MHGIIALGLFALFLSLGLVGRIAVQRGRTGDTGLRVFTAPAFSEPWLADLFMALASLLCALGIMIGAVDALPPVFTPLPVLGMALALAGTIGCFGSQLWMGASWRIGVRQGERTQLVDKGPFSVVRNPIFAAVLMFLLGITLLIPHPLMVLGFVLAVLGIEIQVRLVEEPHLIRIHGDAYVAYRRKVGRFVPFIGRL
jgi:protein-S-isoprenylcysteine O-methyltransferase Ste14